MSNTIILENHGKSIVLFYTQILLGLLTWMGAKDFDTSGWIYFCKKISFFSLSLIYVSLKCINKYINTIELEHVNSRSMWAVVYSSSNSCNMHHGLAKICSRKKNVKCRSNKEIIKISNTQVSQSDLFFCKLTRILFFASIIDCRGVCLCLQ